VKTFCPIHRFDVTFQEARHIQCELSDQVKIVDTIVNSGEIDLIGGADVAFIKSTPDLSTELDSDNKTVNADSLEHHSPVSNRLRKNATAIAVAVAFDIKHSRIVETACATAPVFFPYVPGFLSFREGLAVLRAVGNLSVLPEVMMYDGCGIAHPRRLGLASHMALLTGIPSVGCAKSLLCGICSKPGVKKGMWTAITWHDTVVGTCLRTRDNVRPVYVSPGSGLSIEGSRKLVLSLSLKHRLPEPTRIAHNLVTEQKKKFSLIHV